MTTAVLTLAACGGSESDAHTTAEAAAIAAAAQETLDAGTARVTVTAMHTRSEATWGIEAGERAASLEGVVDFERHLVALANDGSRTVIDETTVYFRDEGEADKRWHRYDLDGKPKEPGVLLVRRYDPTHLLTFLAENDFGPAAIRGEEEIRGTTTTHHHGIVENEALARVLTPDFTYEEIVTSQAYPPDPIPEHTSLEAWVGDDGRLHRVAYEFDAFGTLFGERVIVELYDFGVAVNVDVPAREETIDG